LRRAASNLKGDLAANFLHNLAPEFITAFFKGIRFVNAFRKAL
jgi:hypothetical protein